MKYQLFFGIAASIVLAAPASAFSQAADGQGQAIVTVLPEHEGQPTPGISADDLEVKVNGKVASITHLSPLRPATSPVELVLMIDGSARPTLGTQFGDITGFVRELPPNTKMAIAYMNAGSATFTGPLSSDPQEVLRALRLPAGPIGVSGSPYFCLSDLAKHWPSSDPRARRVVVMVTDGVDYHNMRYDPEDPYVQTAIKDSVQARLTVFSIYWRNSGLADRTWYETDAGQNLLTEVTEATGGSSYWQGLGNPVSFQPYFEDLRMRLKDQYAITVAAQVKGQSEIETLKVTAKSKTGKMTAPQQVYVSRATTTAENE